MVMISSLSVRIQAVISRDLMRLRRAHWMVPKKDNTTVLEYWQGYFSFTLACISIHDPKQLLPAKRSAHPIIQFSGFIAVLLYINWWVSSLWSFVKGTPLYIVNNKAPPMHIKAPITIPIPALLFMFSFSTLHPKKMGLRIKLNLSSYNWNIRHSVYLNIRAITNVTAGVMLIKAQANVADVYDSPNRKKYWVKLALKYNYISVQKKVLIRLKIGSLTKKERLKIG